MTNAVYPSEIARALQEIEQTFPGQVNVEPDAAGAIVRIVGIELSAQWAPAKGDLWFLIPFHYPDAAIYPYYVTGAARSEYVVALQPVEWRGLTATQVSLRHNGWNPTVDTALGSIRQTAAWLRLT